MNVNSDTSLLPSYLLPFNRTANAANANSASSVQQQADVHSPSTADQFLTQLRQVQSPEQFQAMISRMSGQPQQADTTASAGANSAASSGTPSTAKHCQAGSGRSVSSASQSNAISAFQAQGSQQNRNLFASLFGSINPPQTAALVNLA
jgi:hypothetical protein